MSWYVDYYIGYRTPEGKIYPLGVFDCFGKLQPVLTKSKSFTSDLWEDFSQVTLEETTDELRQHFYNGNPFSWKEESEEEKMSKPPWCFWMYLDDLPTGDYLKRGYYLQDEISQYERFEEYFDGFYDMLTPAEYARKMESELKFGVPKPEKDAKDNEIEVHSCGEYSYYVYPDYESEEYETFMIKSAASIFEYSKLPKGSKLVVLQSHG